MSDYYKYTWVLSIIPAAIGILLGYFDEKRIRYKYYASKKIEHEEMYISKSKCQPPKQVVSCDQFITPKTMCAEYAPGIGNVPFGSLCPSVINPLATEKETNCRNCGAPVEENGCDYCGTGRKKKAPYVNHTLSKEDMLSLKGIMVHNPLNKSQIDVF